MNVIRAPFPDNHFDAVFTDQPYYDLSFSPHH